MPINPDAVGAEGGPVERSWDARQCMLYALGVGCGLDELQFDTEKNQQVLPTFAVIIGGGGAPMGDIGEFNPAMLVHGEQAIELLRPIPSSGKLRSRGKIAAVWDKGSGAVVETESESVDVESGEPLLRTRSSMFIRGEGGFGGERGPSAEKFEPGRAPDQEISYTTRGDQALIYRLSGDMNPLHSDPDFAKMGGFDKPILHGLCTYGFTGRALLHGLCGSDPSRFKSMAGRFSQPVIPGETLTVRMWVNGGDARFQTVNQNGEVVLDQGRFTFSE